MILYKCDICGILLSPGNTFWTVKTPSITYELCDNDFMSSVHSLIQTTATVDKAVAP